MSIDAAYEFALDKACELAEKYGDDNIYDVHEYIHDVISGAMDSVHDAKKFLSKYPKQVICELAMPDFWSFVCTGSAFKALRKYTNIKFRRPKTQSEKDKYDEFNRHDTWCDKGYVMILGSKYSDSPVYYKCE